MSNSLKNLHGFTLIELILVIVVLGVLSAVAAPKFINLQAKSRAAVIEGVGGAIRASTTLIYSVSLTEGKTLDATESVAIIGGTVATVFGYPAATAVGIETAIEIGASDFTFAHDATATPSVSTIRFTGYTDCEVTFTQAANSTTPPVIMSTTACATKV